MACYWVIRLNIFSSSDLVMVKLTNIMSLTGLGLRDWMIQRVSSVILAAYVLFLCGFFLLHPQIQYVDWHELFSNLWMRVFSIIVLLSLILHAWIGMWTIATDYLKITWIRLGFEVLMIIALVCYLIWGIVILFS